MTDINDMTPYAGSPYIRYDDVVSARRREKIKALSKGEFDRPVIEFESGARFTLNKTNTSTLICAYGKDPARGSVGPSSSTRARRSMLARRTTAS